MWEIFIGVPTSNWPPIFLVIYACSYTTAVAGTLVYSNNLDAGSKYCIYNCRKYRAVGRMTSGTDIQRSANNDPAAVAGTQSLPLMDIASPAETRGRRSRLLGTVQSDGYQSWNSTSLCVVLYKWLVIVSDTTQSTWRHKPLTSSPQLYWAVGTAPSCSWQNAVPMELHGCTVPSDSDPQWQVSMIRLLRLENERVIGASITIHLSLRRAAISSNRWVIMQPAVSTVA